MVKYSGRRQTCFEIDHVIKVSCEALIKRPAYLHAFCQTIQPDFGATAINGAHQPEPGTARYLLHTFGVFVTPGTIDIFFHLSPMLISPRIFFHQILLFFN